MTAWQKKYRWRITWPGESLEDWSALDGDLIIGRISRDKTSLKAGQFRWAGNCSTLRGARQRYMPHMGHEVEAWQAAKAVEDWYERLLDLNWLRPKIKGRQPDILE